MRRKRTRRKKVKTKKRLECDKTESTAVDFGDSCSDFSSNQISSKWILKACEDWQFAQQLLQYMQEIKMGLT